MVHSRVAGRETELRRLVDAVRRLHSLAVNNTADAVQTSALAATTQELVEELRSRHRPIDQRFGGMGLDRNVNDIFPFDIMLGEFNPIGPAIDVTEDETGVVGSVTFTTAYEGPPGCCHGGIIAAAFDQVFNAANILGDTAGFTTELSIDYRQPTRLEVETTFHAAVETVDGRKVVTRGWSEQEGAVTCEATGVFVALR